MITQFGNYLLDEALATGGMARVYRARLRGLAGFEKPLVVKQVLPELARDPRFVEMFVREAKTLVAMNHPHIVSVYELGVVDGVYFLAMEYVEGATIAELLGCGGALRPEACAQLMLQVCDALEYAHDRFAILHRDLSPRNIIVDRSGHARLLDFGLATQRGSVEGAGFGSAGYMPPEQWRGESVSVQSDLFALGAVLHEALCGEPAFLRASREATKRAVLEAPAPSLDASAHPEPLVTLVSELLRAAPDERPDTAQAVGRVLRGYLSRAAPEGALRELSRRVDQAREARQARGPGADDGSSHVPSSASAAARTLATSRLLDEARRKSAPKPVPTDPGTQPITGRKSVPVPTDPGTRPITGRKPAPVPTDAGTRPITGRKPMPEADPPGTSSPPAVRAQGRASRRSAWTVGGLGLLAGVGLAMGVAAWVRQPPAPEAAPVPPSEREIPPAPASQPTPPVSPEPAPVAPQASPPPAPAEAATGGLEVNALPWAELSLDGRNLGPTPLRKKALPAGKHALLVRCPPLGRQAKVPIVIPEGRTVRVVVDLSVEPPKVDVR